MARQQWKYQTRLEMISDWIKEVGRQLSGVHQQHTLMMYMLCCLSQYILFLVFHLRSKLHGVRLLPPSVQN